MATLTVNIRSDGTGTINWSTFTFNAGTSGCTGSLVSGIPTTVCAGKKINGSGAFSTWTLTTTWTALGVPSGATITAVTTNSGQGKCTVFNTPGTTNADSGGTLTDGATTVQLDLGRNLTATDASFVTSTGIDSTGRSLAAADSISFSINAVLETGNSSSANVTLQQDNYQFTITYTAAGATLASYAAAKSKAKISFSGSTAIAGRALSFSSVRPQVSAKTSLSGLAKAIARGAVSPLTYAAPLTSAAHAMGRGTLSLPGLKAAISALGRGASAASAQMAPRTSLSGRGLSAAKAWAGPSYLASLSGTAKAIAKATVSPSFKTALAAVSRAMASANGLLSAAGTGVALVARTVGISTARVTARVSASLSSRAGANSSGRASGAYLTQILARATSIAKATISFSGKVSISARGAVLSSGRGLLAISSKVALVALAIGRTSARGALKGALSLTARATSASSGRVTATFLIHLAGIARSAGKGVAAFSLGPLNLLARAASAATGRTNVGASLTLMARATGTARAVAAPAYSAVLTASGKAVATAAGELAGMIPLVAHAFATSWAFLAKQTHRKVDQPKLMGSLRQPSLDASNDQPKLTSSVRPPTLDASAEDPNLGASDKQISLIGLIE